MYMYDIIEYIQACTYQYVAIIGKSNLKGRIKSRAR